MKEFELIFEKINELFKHKENVLIAIDGRCAAGKSTLAAVLGEKTDCCVIYCQKASIFLRYVQNGIPLISWQLSGYAVIVSHNIKNRSFEFVRIKITG